MKRLRASALTTITLGILSALILTISAFGQQEVDPSWYDPWAKSAGVTTQQAKAPAHEHKKTTIASAARPKRKQESRRAKSRREASRVETALATK